ncbi:DUF397 domain-containing protein [Streptomyces sp. NPDC047197]|uniref:DUF397 domain-containing protein n=1 Tax=Streptomyces sp. NPDC047197 TaxID=3155477 RepID=UPI003400FB84
MTPATGSSGPLTSQWRKSSHSNGSGGECVEVAAVEQAVIVRDSKRPDAPRVTVQPSTWSEFLTALQQVPPL